MENKRNYYRLLHVQFDAPEAVIKGSYRTMMQKMRLHPDLGGDESNAQLLNQALAILTHPRKRALYDQWLKKHQPESLEPCQRSSDTNGEAQVSQSVDPPTERSSQSQSFNDKLVLCEFCQAENHLFGGYNKNWKSPSPICRCCHAPLKKADQINPSTSEELRRLHRNELLIACEVQPKADFMETISAQVIDFSVLGLRITHAGNLPEGQSVLIRSAHFTAVARVSYTIDEGDERGTSGLEFLTLDLHMSRGELFTANY